jgi:hypothetical protein
MEIQPYPPPNMTDAPLETPDDSVSYPEDMGILFSFQSAPDCYQATTIELARGVRSGR